MHISYKPLWHTLLERDMRKEDLRLAAGEQGLGRSRLLFVRERFFFHWLKFCQKTYQDSAWMSRQLHLHLLFCFVIGYFHGRKTHGLNVKFYRENSLCMACGNSFHFAGQIVIPQDITQFMAN